MAGQPNPALRRAPRSAFVWRALVATSVFVIGVLAGGAAAAGAGASGDATSVEADWVDPQRSTPADPARRQARRALARCSIDRRRARRSPRLLDVIARRTRGQRHRPRAGWLSVPSRRGPPYRPS